MKDESPSSKLVTTLMNDRINNGKMYVALLEKAMEFERQDITDLKLVRALVAYYEQIKEEVTGEPHVTSIDTLAAIKHKETHIQRVSSLQTED